MVDSSLGKGGWPTLIAIPRRVAHTDCGCPTLRSRSWNDRVGESGLIPEIAEYNPPAGAPLFAKPPAGGPHPSRHQG